MSVKLIFCVEVSGGDSNPDERELMILNLHNIFTETAELATNWLPADVFASSRIVRTPDELRVVAELLAEGLL